MSLFAGFWVDGAVRQPEEHCFDRDGLIQIKWKRDFPDLDIVTTKFSPWREVYWLDTTPRESLTPEELFSLLKVIWPKTQVVNNPEGGAIVGWQVPHDATDDATPIEWGGLTQYPPDLDWVRVTKDNVSQHLFKDCRHRDSGTWLAGQVLGWDVDCDKCIVLYAGSYESWRDVEVRVQGAE